MRFHGSVSLVLLAVSTPALGQESSIPRLLGSPDVRLAPDVKVVPPPAVPPPAIGSTGNLSILESELEALRADLQTFHAVREDVARSARDLEAKSDRVSTQQRQEVLDLLTKLATQGIVRKPAREQDPLPQAPRPNQAGAGSLDSGNPLVITDATVDPFALGKVLFRSGDFVKAEQAFRRVTPTEDNRELLKYLIATCQYRRKQINEAMEGYREIAGSNDDPVIRDMAKVQLDGIRWRQEIDQELEQLRKQREKQSGAVAPKSDSRSRK